MKRIAKWSIQSSWSKYRIKQIERYLGVCGVVGGLNRYGLNSAWCTHNLLKPIWLPGNPESCWCWVFSCVMWGCVWVCVYTYTHVHEVGGSWKLLIDGHFSKICYKPQKQSRRTSQAFPWSPSYFHMHGNSVSDIQMNSLSCTGKKWGLMGLSIFNWLCEAHIHMDHMFHFSTLGQTPVSQAESLSVCEWVCGRVNVPWRSLSLWVFSIFTIFTTRHSFNLLVTPPSPYYLLNKNTKQH